MARGSMHFQLNLFPYFFVQTIGQLKCRDKCVVDTLTEVVSTCDPQMVSMLIFRSRVPDR